MACMVYRRPSAPSIYLIGSDELPSRVKIGYGANPHARMRLLQTGSPVLLTILGSLPGGQIVEKALHEHFRDLRLHGEWFDFGSLDPLETVTAVYENLDVASMIHAEGSRLNPHELRRMRRSRN